MTSNMNINEDYIFSIKNIIEYTKHVSKNSILKQEIKQNIKKDRNRFLPNHKDKLFWCLFVIIYGLDEYEMIGTHFFEKEQKLKFDFIEQVRKHKDKLKANQFKPLSSFEDDLANNSVINLNTFMALLCIYDKNICFRDCKKIYCSIRNESQDNFLLTKLDANVENYELELGDGVFNKIEDLKATLYEVPSYQYKLKSISSYKMDELKEMCNKFDLNISYSGKILKKDLYEKLKVFF